MEITQKKKPLPCAPSSEVVANDRYVGAAAMAPWFRLCLPSCGPGFESQAHHLRFLQFTLLKLLLE